MDGTILVRADMRKVKLMGAIFNNITDDDVLFYGKKPWSGHSTGHNYGDILPYFQDD